MKVALSEQGKQLHLQLLLGRLLLRYRQRFHFFDRSTIKYSKFLTCYLSNFLADPIAIAFSIPSEEPVAMEVPTSKRLHDNRPLLNSALLSKDFYCSKLSSLKVIVPVHISILFCSLTFVIDVTGYIFKIKIIFQIYSVTCQLNFFRDLPFLVRQCVFL